MNSDYVIVFPATTKYMDEARVLLKSLTKNMPHVPVHIMTRRAEANCLKDEFSIVEEIIDEPPCDTEFRQVRTSRFRHASDISDRYKVVCLLDADMCCVRDFTVFFKMAEAGAILVGSNNTLLRYRKKDFDHMHVEAPDDIDVVHATFTTVPTILNPTIHKDYLTTIFNNKTGNDLDVPNLVACSMGLMKSVYHLPSYIVTNIHHTMVKPETGLKRTSDGLYSGQGEPVYLIHGHLGDQRYIDELIRPMEKNYGWHRKHIEHANNCIRALTEEYRKYANM